LLLSNLRPTVTPSEVDIKSLFADFVTTSSRLGNTIEDKNLTLAAVLKGKIGLDFGHDFYDMSDASKIDLFGDAYEFPTMLPVQASPVVSSL
jgi:type I restriction enzyme M protein